MVSQVSHSLADSLNTPPLGPVIRHNPDQIHINDPDFFEEVYNLTNGRTEKPREVAEVFGPYPAVSFVLKLET